MRKSEIVFQHSPWRPDVRHGDGAFRKRDINRAPVYVVKTSRRSHRQAIISRGRPAGSTIVNAPWQTYASRPAARFYRLFAARLVDGNLLLPQCQNVGWCNVGRTGIEGVRRIIFETELNRFPPFSGPPGSTPGSTRNPIPAVTPPPVTRLRSTQTRVFIGMASNALRNSIALQCVAARYPLSRPAAPSTSDPVQTDVIKFGALFPGCAETRVFLRRSPCR